MIEPLFKKLTHNNCARTNFFVGSGGVEPVGSTPW
jgi:hypothetical protein